MSWLLLPLGLLVPGFFFACALGYRRWWAWASGFVISLLVLFHSVFWLGIFHVPIRLWTVVPCLATVSAAGAWLARRSAVPRKSEPATAWRAVDRVLLVSTAVVGVIFLTRSAISPLMGFDTLFRWDFLAQRMLALGRFDFYPPLTAADFRTYFYVDGIPPLVSFTHWWLYASAGRYLPALIPIFVGAQFAATLAFTYWTGEALYSRRAGVLAAAVLAACPLYFRAAVIGQETGLTALGIAAMLYFISTARPDDKPAMISAGLAAALCALSREYGWIALAAGAVALLWRRVPVRQTIIFGAVAAAAAAPWYVRSWMLTGNPFYSIRFLGLPVNPIHDALLQSYRATSAIEHWNGDIWAGALWILLTWATVQVLAGIPGGMLRFRHHGYLLVIAGLWLVVWIQAQAYTVGGLDKSMRVLSPAMVVLSLTAAGLLDRVRRPGMVAAAVVLFQILTAAHGVFYSWDPLRLRPDEWAQHAFSPTLQQEMLTRDWVAGVLPAGTRVLSDNAALHAVLIDKGIEVVPVWSPEVRFLFTSPPEEAERRLRAARIGVVALPAGDLNTPVLISASPFYAALPERWQPLAVIPDVLYIFVPKQR